MRGKPKDETGNRYGHLLVIRRSHSDGSFVFWECVCDCGNLKVTRGHTLRLGKCRSCGLCDIQKKSAPDTPQKLSFRNYRTGARNRNLSFNIDFKTFLRVTALPCYLCGREPYERKYAFTRRRYSQGVDADVSAVFNGIDRLNSELGYEDFNIAACCTMCNRMKSDFSFEAFKEKVFEIYKNLEEK